jgi:hypothetical protein
MRDSSKNLLDGGTTNGFGAARAFILLLALVCCRNALAADPLWITNPAEIAFSVSELTQEARALGLSDSDLSRTLSGRLTAAGLTPKLAEIEQDDGVLFLDIIVEKQTYYASLGFWRVATIQHPDGRPSSDFVIVWQDYSVGAHHDDPAEITDTVQQIIERFITTYSAANDLDTPLQAAAQP